MAASSGSSEVAKLQQHLDLLRDQYVKLQQKHAELEQKYTTAVATSGNAGTDHFISRLLKLVSDLFDKPLYSDLTIMLSDRTLCGHKLVLVARSRHWNNKDDNLSSTAQLDLSNMTPFVAVSLVRWVYTDVIVLPSDQDAIIELLAASNRYQLKPLKEKCEQNLISTVSVRNCIKLYQTSEEHAAESLKTYCLQIISSHWNNLNTRDFADLSAPLLYDMFKAHTEYPLHLAIQHLREDVVFLFLIEYNSQLPHRLNECDNEGNIPLNLALLNRHEGIATTLVSHKCDLDSVDAEGNSLLHLAILRGDSFAASFLIKNGCNTTLARHSTLETPLHLVASYNPSRALATVSTASVSKAPWPSDSMVNIASQLLEFKANPNAQDCDGCTALHRAIQCGNAEVFDVLLSSEKVDLDLCNNARDSALWLGLSQLDSAHFTSDDVSQYDNSFPAKLITRGANPDTLDPRSGNILLHRAALESNEAAAIFLVYHRAQLNPKNGEGEAPIHIAARKGLHNLVEVLLQHGADPNQQTTLRVASPVSPVPSAAAAAVTPQLSPPPPPDSLRKRSESPQPVVPPSSLPAPPHPPASSSSQTSTTTTPSPHSPAPSWQGSLSGRTGGDGGGGGGGGGMMDFDLTSSSAMSSAALGALSALSATSQALSGLQSFGGYDGGGGGGYSVSGIGGGGGGGGGRGSGYSVIGGGGKEFSSLPAGVRPPGGSRANPFGADSDEEEEGTWQGNRRGGGGGGGGGEVSGYRVSPLRQQSPIPTTTSSSSSTTNISSGLGTNSGQRNSSRTQHTHTGGAQQSQQQTQSHRTPAAPLGRTISNLSPPSPTSPLGSEAKEFIEPRVEFDATSDLGGRTALHLAIAHRFFRVVNVLLSHTDGGSSGKLQMGLDLNLRDGLGETAMGLALWTEQFDTAQRLLQMGAELEAGGGGRGENEEGGGSIGVPGLLYVAIVREKPRACLFLLEHGADFNTRTAEDETLLLLSIRHQLHEVVDKLCGMGADLSVGDNKGNSPLWVALRSRQETCAGKLVVHGCDPNAWHRNSDGVQLTLLHRAILLHDTATAVFLIRNGADVNSATRPGTPGGEFYPPLHLACERGMEEVVQCLLEHRANVNATDSSRNTGLHVSIKTKNNLCSHLLLAQSSLDLATRNKADSTVFATALEVKDNEVGKAILQRNPNAAEQVDSKGQNFLHLAILKQDVEAVIFLLSVKVNVNSKVQNPTHNTALHYAVKGGSEILVRHLLLAEARVSDVDNHQRTVLHMAVEGEFSSVVSVLLENGADPDQADEEGNTALHTAFQVGNVSCAEVVLHDSEANLGAVNNRGENCLHVLARYSKENAPVLFSLLVQIAPGFPIDVQDRDGNTALLLAYIAGNTGLCDALIRAGAHPGIANKQNVSIFSSPVATKQLMFRILDQISKEPVWLEGNFCQNCQMKFSISHRKHHCRHCGRLLCKQCSSRQMPILKFELSKPVRLCEVCSDAFTVAATR